MFYRRRYPKKSTSYVKRYRKRTYRGKYKRRYVKKNRRPSQPWTPLGTRRVVKHVYCQEIAVDAGAGSSIDYVFSANGMYDCDITGTGHQPYGFDTMATMFQHYTVVGSKCTVTYATNNGVPFWAAVELDSDNTNKGGQEAFEILERAGTNARLSGVTGTTGTLQMTKGFGARKFFGKDEIVGESQYRGDQSANPTEGAFYHIQLAPQGADNLDLQTLMIKIEYTAVWTEPKSLGTS